ncbi:hypothetical protein ACWDD9_43070 [Kitasatospora sp. NPDC001119]
MAHVADVEKAVLVALEDPQASPFLTKSAPRPVVNLRLLSRVMIQSPRPAQLPSHSSALSVLDLAAGRALVARGRPGW